MILEKKNDMIKKVPLLFFGIFSLSHVKAQNIQDFFFNLYTDSLKIGTFNYINIDALLTSGSYYPLDNKTVEFLSSAGTWDGNSLFLDSALKVDSVVITATLKKNRDLQKTITIFIKKGESAYKVKTEKELMDELNKKKRHH